MAWKQLGKPRTQSWNNNNVPANWHTPWNWTLVADGYGPDDTAGNLPYDWLYSSGTEACDNMLFDNTPGICGGPGINPTAPSIRFRTISCVDWGIPCESTCVPSNAQCSDTSYQARDINGMSCGLMSQWTNFFQNYAGSACECGLIPYDENGYWIGETNCPPNAEAYYTCDLYASEGYTCFQLKTLYNWPCQGCQCNNDSQSEINEYLINACNGDYDHGEYMDDGELVPAFYAADMCCHCGGGNTTEAEDCTESQQFCTYGGIGENIGLYPSIEDCTLRGQSLGSNQSCISNTSEFPIGYPYVGDGSDLTLFEYWNSMYIPQDMGLDLGTCQVGSTSTPGGGMLPGGGTTYFVDIDNCLNGAIATLVGCSGFSIGVPCECECILTDTPQSTLDWVPTQFQWNYQCKEYAMSPWKYEDDLPPAAVQPSGLYDQCMFPEIWSSMYLIDDYLPMPTWTFGSSELALFPIYDVQVWCYDPNGPMIDGPDGSFLEGPPADANENTGGTIEPVDDEPTIASPQLCDESTEVCYSIGNSIGEALLDNGNIEISFDIYITQYTDTPIYGLQMGLGVGLTEDSGDFDITITGIDSFNNALMFTADGFGGESDAAGNLQLMQSGNTILLFSPTAEFWSTYTGVCPTNPCLNSININTPTFLFNVSAVVTPSNTSVTNTYLFLSTGGFGNNENLAPTTSTANGVGMSSSRQDYYWELGSGGPLMEWGDFNNDGVVNIVDVVQLINCILASSWDADYCSQELMDLNNDNVNNVVDIVQLVNYIFSDDRQSDTNHHKFNRISLPSKVNRKEGMKLVSVMKSLQSQQNMSSINKINIQNAVGKITKKINKK